MKYSYEYKKECVKLYREGIWPKTPAGTNKRTFRKSIRLWVRLEELHGPEILKHGNNINWNPEQKLEIVSKVLAGNSIKSVAIEAGINPGQLHSWLRKYKICRKFDKETMNQRNKSKPKELNESEREELIRLRAENEYIKAENEVIKKEIALRENNYAAQLKAKKQQSSKNSKKKDTN